MLKIISGEIRSDKTDIIKSLIKTSVLNNEDVLVIVPDQYSFEFDKDLYNTLGAKKFNSITSMGFNRFAQVVVKKYGSKKGKRADENSRTIAMYKALRQVEKDSQAEYFKKSIKKPGFIKDAITLCGTLKKSGIAPNDIKTKELELDGIIKQKISGISDIYSAYIDVMDKSNLLDELSMLEEAAKISKEYNLFFNKTIFIHEFSYFSYDEYQIIGEMFKNAKDIVVSLIIGDGNNLTSNLTPFKTPIRCERTLIEMAKENGQKFEKIMAKKTYLSADIKAIEENIFSNHPNKKRTLDGSVELIKATSIKKEIEYIGAKIRELVREQGYKYSDIVLVTRSFDTYACEIENIFKKYDIPVYLDQRQGATHFSVSTYIFSVFDCVVSRTFKTDNILKYIKSPLCNLEYWESSTLEEYAIKWGVEGDVWKSDFIASDNNEQEKYLDTVNSIRKKVIDPIVKFKEATQGKTAGDICISLNELLMDIKLSDRAFHFLGEMSESNDSEMIKIKQDFRQIWNLLLSCINSIYKQMENEKITIRQYYNLLKLMLSQLSISSPPQNLDSVTVAKAEHSRLGDIKVAFVVGVNDKLFPKTVSDTGLLTDKDKSKLNKVGLEIVETLEQNYDYERYITYLSLGRADEKLYVSYPLSDMKNAPLSKSGIINEINNILPLEVVSTKDISIEKFIGNKSSGYMQYLENINEKNLDISSLKEALLSDNDYKERLKFLSDLSIEKNHTLEKFNSKNLFFKSNLNITATRTDDFYKCHFNYFCKNGLKIYPLKKKEINSMTKGNLVHYVLEKILSKTENGKTEYNIDFEKMSEEEIKSNVKTLVNEYVLKALGGNFSKDKRFTFNLSAIQKSVYNLVLNVKEELIVSKFKPTAFEYSLAKEDGKSMLSFKVNDDITVNIFGFIDRVDIYKDEDDNRYVRILDYKTGGKIFKLTDFYYGLNMQMIIYLLALTNGENGINYDGKLVPAGVLYMPAKSIKSTLERSMIRNLSKEEIDKKVEEERKKLLKRNGLLVDDIDVINAMDTSGETNGYFTSVRLNKDKTYSQNGNTPLNYERFIAIEKFAAKKIKQMAEELSNGNINATPVCEDGKRDSISCRYCDYWSVCGKYNTFDTIEITDDSELKLNEELDKIIQKDGEQNA